MTIVPYDTEGVPGGSPEPIPGKCGAKRTQGPGYCMVDPMANGRCYKHGGNTPAGSLSVHYKHGRYVDNLPRQLAERYLAAAEDPQLLGYREDTALVQARIEELLERVRSGESGLVWKTLNKLWREFTKYRAAGDVKNMQLILEQIDEPMRRGLTDHAAWEEIGTQLDRRARLVDAERRRLDQVQNTMTVEEALGLLGTVLDVLKRHVTDEDTLDAIGAELEQLVTLDAVPLATRARRRRR